MGEELKLLCSETCPSNNGKDLKDIFIHRFKLHDGFWNDLFDSNCPKGLGTVNEKLRNGEDLSANDFKSLDESSHREEAERGKNKENVLEFKTPIFVKTNTSLSNTIHSPSLFSPATQDYELQSKGPTSSTPLPWKSVHGAALTITPKTTKNIAQNDFRTPEHKRLDYMPYNTRTTTSKLSASLVMDPLEQMDLSWSSSLATPPGCPKQQSVNTEDFQGIQERKSSFEISEIPLEELDIIKAENKSKPKPKGVARILFVKETKSSKTDAQTSKDYSFENTTFNEKDLLTISKSSGVFSSDAQSENKPTEKKSIGSLENEQQLEGVQDANLEQSSMDSHDCRKLCEYADLLYQDNFTRRSVSENNEHLKHAKSDEVDHIEIDSLSHFNMSLLSPLQEKAISELSALAHTRKSPAGVNTISSLIKNTLDKIEEISTCGRASNEVVEDVCDLSEDLALSVKEDVEINPETMDENTNNKDFKDLFDMDALSEFPIDFDLSQCITVSSRSYQGGNVHSVSDNVNSDKDDQCLTKDSQLRSEGKTELAMKNGIEGSEMAAIKISRNDELLNNKMYGCNGKSTKHAKFVEGCHHKSSELSLISEKGYMNMNKSTSDSGKKFLEAAGQNETSTTKRMETASQVLQDLSLRQLSDISYDVQSMSHGESNSQIIQSPDHVEQNAHTRDKEDNQTLTTVRTLEVTARQNETSTKRVETASQVLQDISLRQLSDISYDAQSMSHGESNSQNIQSPDHIEQNALTRDKEINQTLTVELSVKAVSVSEKSVKPSGKLLSDVDIVKDNLGENAVAIKQSATLKLTAANISEEAKTNATSSSIKMDKGNDKLQVANSFDVGKCEKGKPPNPFVRFSTASGKKVTVSEKSMQKARQFLNEFKKEEENSRKEAGRRFNGKDNVAAFIKVKEKTKIGKGLEQDADEKETIQYNKDKLSSLPTVVLERMVNEEKVSFEEQLIVRTCDGDDKMKCQYNKPIEKIVNIGFSTASGKKVEVSMKSLNRAKQILNDVMQEESKGFTEVRKSAKLTNMSFSDSSENTVSKVVSNNRRDNINDLERNKLKSLDKKSRQDMGFKFSTASGKDVAISKKSLAEAKSILNKVDKIEDSSSKWYESPGLLTAATNKIKLSEEFLFDSENCSSKAEMNEGKRASGSPKRSKELNNIPSGNNEGGDKGNCRFSSASEKKVTISEESLMKAQTPSGIGGKQPLRMPCSYIQCQLDTSQEEVTVSGQWLDENEVDRNPVEMKSNFVLSIASEKDVAVQKKEKPQNNAQIFDDSIDFNKTNSIPSDNTFIVAPGNNSTVLDENSDFTYNVEGASKTKTAIGFSTPSGKRVTISQDSLDESKRILNDLDMTINAQEMNELLKKKSTTLGFTTASGNKVTVSEASLKKAKGILDDIENEEYCKTDRSFCKIPKFGFSTASGNEIVVSEESLKKARKILNEVDKEVHTSERKMTNGKHDNPFSTSSASSAKNKPLGFTTASGNNVTVSEASIQKVKGIFNDIENEECSKEGNSFSKIPKFGFSTASGNEIVVSEESLKKARKILNNVDKELHTSERKMANGKHDNPFSTSSASSAKNKPLGFTTASGNNVTVSEASIQKVNGIFNDIENEECSKEGNSFTKIPKFGFSTASGNEISISEESLKKARNILNEVDKEEHRSERKITSEKHDNQFSTSSAKNKPLGFTTASGNNVTVSEASIQKVKGIFNDIEKEECSKEGNSFSKIPTFGLSTASGNEIAVSEESLKNVPKNFNEVNDEERQLKDKVKGHDVVRRKNIQKIKEKENGLNDNANGNDRTLCVKSGFSPIFQNDITRLVKSSKIPESCDKTISTPKRILGSDKASDIESRRKHKRLLSEIEIENGRACKASRTDREMETRQDGRIWMTPNRSDPLVEYHDRKYSKFKSPLRAVVVSPNLGNTNKLSSSDQPVDVECKHTPINAKSKPRPGSHFKTPYRATETIVKQGKCNLSESISSPNNTNTPLNDYSKSGKGKTKSVKQEIKELSVKPRLGSIYKLRNNASFKLKRISFADYVCNVNKRWTSGELVKYGIPPAVLSITSENADSYRFKGLDFLSEVACATNTGVRYTEGAVLFLGEDKCVGLPQFTKAFLSSPGVDPKLISEEWIANHFKWIVWKLASYEVSYPQFFFGRSFTPDMVLRQLKYRYDREVDHCERSAIKKILERDDNSSRSMVLCVASLVVTEFDKNNESKGNCESRKLEAQKTILMTDGWYSIRVQLDEYLQNLVKENKIYIGQKLYIQGAELCGSDQAVSPLEAPSNLYLRIHGNSTRPAKQFSRLGFHCTNNIFTVPIKSISSTGGLVSSINVIVVRQYPLQFMEKLPDGSCVFRNPRCEERIAKKFEEDVHKKREKVMSQVQTEIDNEETKATRRTKGRKSLSNNLIQNLSDGKEMFDVISNATDPSSVENCLSAQQRRILDNYKENLHNDRAATVRRTYEEAWKKLCDEEILERNVVPVLKVKLVDCFPSKTNQTPGTALLTVWRPTEQIITTLGEGKRLKIYNLQASRYSKGNNTVQLTANRCTIYKAVLSNTTCQNTFQDRKTQVYTFREISNGLRPGVEVDIVAVVIFQQCQPSLTLVYMVDSDLNFVRVKIWGGLQGQGLQDVMKEKNFVAACNLLSQPDRRFGIPSLKYYELSLVTSNPSNKMLRHRLYELRKTVSNLDSFVTKAKAKLDELFKDNSSCSTPKAQTISLLNAATSESAGKRRRTTETPLMQNKEANVQMVGVNGAVATTACTPATSASQSESILQSRKRLLHLKRRKLDLVPNPPPLSPLLNALPLSASARKEFKAPRRIRTQGIDDTENEEG